MTEAQATRINIEDGVATGVQFVYQGKRYTVEASREVVLSAGVIQSPQLLELSGVGDPDVLKDAGIELKVENKGVGANFQDQYVKHRISVKRVTND